MIRLEMKIDVSEAVGLDEPAHVALTVQLPDPSGLPGELRAYPSSASVDFYICPRMGHMHNFASTRELLWRRIQTWADWVQQHKAFTPD